MEISTLAVMGAKYILKLVTGSKAFDSAKEDVLTRAWKWVKQNVFKMSNALEEKIFKTEGDREKERVVEQELLKLLQQKDFREKFQQWFTSLRSEPSVKNYFGGDIKEIKGNATIGDKLKAGETVGKEKYDIKNVATGNIGTVGGDFHVGDTKE